MTGCLPWGLIISKYESKKHFLSELPFLTYFILFQSLKSQSKTLKLWRVQIPLTHQKNHQNKVCVGDLGAFLQYLSQFKLPSDAYGKQFDAGNTYSFTSLIQPPLCSLFQTKPVPLYEHLQWCLEGMYQFREERALLQFNFCLCLGCCELQKPAIRLSAISYAGHMLCEDAVMEMGTLPTGALGTASPGKPFSCVKGSTRHPANKYQSNIISANPLKILWGRWAPCPQKHWEQLTLLSPSLVLKVPPETQPKSTKTSFLCSYCAASLDFLLMLLAPIFFAPCSLGYKALLLAPCFSSTRSQGRLTVPSVFFLLEQQCGAGHCSAQQESFILIFSAELFCFSSEVPFSIIPLKLSEIWVLHCLALGGN